MKMLNNAIYLVSLVLVLGGLMNQALSPGTESVSDAAVQKITLPPANADRLAFLPSLLNSHLII